MNFITISDKCERLTSSYYLRLQAMQQVATYYYHSSFQRDQQSVFWKVCDHCVVIPHNYYTFHQRGKLDLQYPSSINGPPNNNPPKWEFLFIRMPWNLMLIESYNFPWWFQRIARSSQGFELILHQHSKNSIAVID